MRRRRRRNNRSDPPPPLSSVLLCEFAVLLCRNPLQMTMFVLCYCNPLNRNSLQGRLKRGRPEAPKARSLWPAEAPERGAAGELGGRARARGHAMCRGGGNESNTLLPH